MSTMPDICMTRMPPGSSVAIAKACARHGIRPSEYFRAALWRQLSEDRLSPAQLDVIACRLPLSHISTTDGRVTVAA